MISTRALFLLGLATIWVGANGANILACISSPSRSHHIIETTILVELANRGHNVRFLFIKSGISLFFLIYNRNSLEKKHQNL